MLQRYAFTVISIIIVCSFVFSEKRFTLGEEGAFAMWLVQVSNASSMSDDEKHDTDEESRDAI